MKLIQCLIIVIASIHKIHSGGDDYSISNSISPTRFPIPKLLISNINLDDSDCRKDVPPAPPVIISDKYYESNLKQNKSDGTFSEVSELVSLIQEEISTILSAGKDAPRNVENIEKIIIKLRSNDSLSDLTLLLDSVASEVHREPQQLKPLPGVKITCGNPGDIFENLESLQAQLHEEFQSIEVFVQILKFFEGEFKVKVNRIAGHNEEINSMVYNLNHLTISQSTIRDKIEETLTIVKYTMEQVYLFRENCELTDVCEEFDGVLTVILAKHNKQIDEELRRPVGDADFKAILDKFTRDVVELLNVDEKSLLDVIDGRKSPFGLESCGFEMIKEARRYEINARRKFMDGNLELLN